VNEGTKMKTAIYALIIAALVAIGYGGWCLERWINWKFSYGAKVEARLERVEKRLEALERSK